MSTATTSPSRGYIYSSRMGRIYGLIWIFSIFGVIIPVLVSVTTTDNNNNNNNKNNPIPDNDLPYTIQQQQQYTSSSSANLSKALPSNSTNDTGIVITSTKSRTKKRIERPDDGYNYKAFPQVFSESYLRSTEPRQNASTLGYWRRHFHSGFRNQIMAFSALCMFAGYNGHSQIVVSTLHHKDTYGSDRMLPHEYLFDVEHWNSWFPSVPRLVRCVNFTDLNCTTGKWHDTTFQENATNPYAKGEPFKLFAMYMRYAKKRGKFAEPIFRNPIDVAILKGALRPHPDIQEIMTKVLQRATGGLPYFTLHARVEPDMQKHPVCTFLKVKNLTDIISSIEQAFPVPPATKLFLPINRATLEDGAKIKTKAVNDDDDTNWIAVNNLKTLNHIVKHGLWNGTVQVFELGSTVLNETKYKNTPSTIGAMMNFFLALNSTVFIGTEVSSWSNDVTASRFYRGKLENYKYLPSGLEKWTTPDMKNSPSFLC